MSLDTMRDLLLEQLRDIYSAEKQITKALPRLAKAAANEELAAAFTTHLAETEGQVERLEEVFRILDVSSRGPKCKGMEGLLEEGAEMIKESGEESVIDAGLIADAQRVEHYEIAAYGTAKALAEALNLTDIATLLDATLEEEKNANDRLTEIAESRLYPGPFTLPAAEHAGQR